MSRNVADLLFLGLETVQFAVNSRLSPRLAYMTRKQLQYDNRRENRSYVVAAKEAAICLTSHYSLVVPFGVSGVIAGKV